LLWLQRFFNGSLDVMPVVFVRSVQIDGDGSRVASGSFDQTIKVWDASSGQEKLTLQGHNKAVTSVAFSSDGKRIVSGSNDRKVRLWDAGSGQEMDKLQEHHDRVNSVAFSADGNWVVSASDDRTVKMCDVKPKTPQQSANR
jgi:WD40 repeat protein